MKSSLNEAQHFDRLMEDSGDSWWGNKTLAGRLRNDRRARMLAESVGMQPGKRFIEVGCGHGEYTRRLEKTGAEIYAFDVSASLIDKAKTEKKSKTTHYFVADAEKLPFKQNHFDGAVGNAILHHLDLNKALPELRRVLKNNARVAFTEPNMLNPWVFFTIKVPQFRKRLQYSKDETAFFTWRIKDQFERLRFKNVRVEPIDFLFPGVPDFTARATSRLGVALEKTPIIRHLAGSMIITAEV